MTHAAGRVVLGPASRPLRRLLRPIEWVVLEDVALDARRDGDNVVAATSARAVAEHLGITPGAAAKALARLRFEGLVVLSRQQGPGGRFGLSAYELAAVDGLEVLAGEAAAVDPAPRAAGPRSASPRSARPRAASRHTGTASAATSGPAAATADDRLGQLDLLDLDPHRR
ncbi:MAG TPA: hypothetical protein VFJ85_15625 [Acidimicrobiales bacterium]|nr:hypothetical protein [Acidimicrobiales bacterium]